MAAQDVRELVPRVRRAIEGPVPPATGALTDGQVEALAADCIADIILMTGGDWGHTLAVSEFTGDPPLAAHWEVDPPLELHEQSVVAMQAALTWFFHEFKAGKVSETMRNEGQEWSWSTSSQVLREHLRLLKETRDEALAALAAESPVLARYASILAVRDPVMSAVIEPWVGGGLGGGMVLNP